MAGITNQVRYPNAVPRSKPLIEAAIRDDPNVYPPDEAIARMFSVGTLTAAEERARTRLWSRFKAGR
jgi:putrescine transport system substrate-binding protein